MRELESQQGDSFLDCLFGRVNSVGWSVSRVRRHVE